MITIEQCRAARGLISWTQQDLAEASGLSKTAINNFEKGHSDIKADSLRAILSAFESANIEFLGRSGLRKRSENVKIFHSEYAFENLLDDVFETLKFQGGEVLVSNSIGLLSANASLEKIAQYKARMVSHGITERVINLSTAMDDWGTSETVRFMPHDHFSAHMCSFIYGKKVSFILSDKNIIISVHSIEASHMERHRFELTWNRAVDYKFGLSACRA